ncbi:hypothetical protein AAFC00_004957 [Neodothiora populina]|uniref:Uncharacterized protein n=1 Tax=Neodothiora populina TaxID=2781224 RepID=A0ABR3P4J7_9PEZI
MATAAAAQSHLRSLYRRLLRELPSHHRVSLTPSNKRTGPASLLSHPSPLQTHIRTTLLSPPSTSSPASAADQRTTPTSPLTTATLSDPLSPSSKFNAESGIHAKTQAQRLHEAEQFVSYVQAQREYLSLLERYNPGANMDEEERVRLSARRVGMELPVEVDK